MSKNTVYVVGAHGSEWWLDLQAVRFFFTAKATETQTIWNTWTLLILKRLNQLNGSFWWIFSAFGWHTENLLLNAWKTYFKKHIYDCVIRSNIARYNHSNLHDFMWPQFCLLLIPKGLTHLPQVTCVRLCASKEVLTYHKEHSADRNTSNRSIAQRWKKVRNYN